MPSPTIFPAELSFLGLAKETSNGTAVAPTRYLPFSKFEPKDDNNLLIDDGVRGSMGVEYGAVPGPGTAAVDLSTYFYPDSVGDLLYNVFGGYAVVGAGAPYTHTFSLLNSGDGQPPAHTITDRQGITATVGARAYAYACCSELTISGNVAGLCEVEAKFTSYQSAAAAAAPTNAVTTEVVIPAWRSTVSIAGSPAPNVREWSVTISRDLQVDNTADGTQNPRAIARKGMTVSGKMTLSAVDESPLTAHLAGTQQAIAITIDNGGAAAAQRQLVLTMTKAVYSGQSMARETPIGWEMGFKAIMNATDIGASGGLGPITAALKNAITTY